MGEDPGMDLLSAPVRREVRRRPRVDGDLLVAGTVGVWMTLVLGLDHGAALGAQRLLGVATWVLLIGLARRETPLVRVQIAVVVVFATLIEYSFSGVLHVYVYRLDNVPTFVPPGHGLVYLAALSLGRSRCFRDHSRALILATVVGGGAYAAWGLAISSRPDALGAFWYLCLLGFLLWGRSRMLYVGAFVAVTFLELLGTRLGTWRWHDLDPTGLVTIGNPPSGAAGGYGWFDLAAVLIAPRLIDIWRRRASLTAGVTTWTSASVFRTPWRSRERSSRSGPGAPKSAAFPPWRRSTGSSIRRTTH
jgi:hypothetical protein